MMKRAMKRAKRVTKIRDHKEEPQDFISHLPDEVLWLIISLLPIDDAVRCSILSKRWMSMWKQVSHLEFDVKHMIFPLARVTTSPEAHLDFILNWDKEEGIYRYGILLFLILRQHLGDLTSCCLRHFPVREVGTWILYLVEKKPELKELTLECEPLGTMCKQDLIMEFGVSGRNIFSSLVSLELVRYCLKSPFLFEACNVLRILKLNDVSMGDKTIGGILSSCVSLEKFTLLQCCGFSKIKFRNSSLKFLELSLLRVDEIKVSAKSLEAVILASLCCPAKNLVLKAPNVREFLCSQNRQIPASSDHVLKTPELLEYCSGLLESKRGKIFRKLSSMSIDLDLNNIKEARALSYMLRTSVDLKSLEIVIPFNEHAKVRIPRTASSALPFSRSTFWEGREICNCIRRKLKFVYIEGFTGRDLEVDFIKYLIVRSTKLKRITIVCDGSTRDASDFLSMKSASADLIIKLKTANKSCVIELN